MTTGQKTALGKGLASLLPGLPSVPGAPEVSTSVPTTSDSKDRIPGISLAPIDEIRANPYQPRHDFNEKAVEELAQSIRENGLIQPLIVRRGPISGYELIAGERRLRAARIAGLKQIPIVIRKSTDKESLELAIIENIQRQDLNPMDEAMAYLQLSEEFHLTQEEVARRVGKDRTSIANHLRLLKLPDQVQRNLRTGELSFGHAKVLLGIEGAEEQLKLAQLIIEKAWSVRALEAHLQDIRSKAEDQPSAQATQESQTEKTPVRARLDSIGQELTRKWSTRVRFKGNDRRGKILIEYHSRDELERLISAMHNQDLWPAQKT